MRDENRSPPKDRLVGQIVAAGICLLICVVVLAVHMTRG